MWLLNLKPFLAQITLSIPNNIAYKCLEYETTCHKYKHSVGNTISFPDGSNTPEITPSLEPFSSVLGKAGLNLYLKKLRVSLLQEHNFVSLHSGM